MTKELTEKQKAYLDASVRKLGPTMQDKSRFARLRQEPDEDLRERVFELEQRVEAMADRVRQQPRTDTASGLYDENGEVRCNYPHTVPPTAEETRQFLKRFGYKAPTARP